jgi:hypothetical protein
MIGYSGGWFFVAPTNIVSLVTRSESSGLLESAGHFQTPWRDWHLLVIVDAFSVADSVLLLPELYTGNTQPGWQAP